MYLYHIDNFLGIRRIYVDYLSDLSIFLMFAAENQIFTVMQVYIARNIDTLA